MALQRQLSGCPGKSRYFPLLALILLSVVVVNAGTWLIGVRVFIEDARNMDRQRASQQVARVENLFAREALSLNRILLGRAEYLNRHAIAGSRGLGGLDFAQIVSEEFLAGANLDAYLVADAAGNILHAVALGSVDGELLPLPDTDRRHLGALLQRERSKAAFSGLEVMPSGVATVVVAVPIGDPLPNGWLVARRDLDAEQVIRYGELLEKPFFLMVTADIGPADVGIDATARLISWRMADLEGRPAVALSMAFDDDYERHMAGMVIVARAAVLLLTLLVGALMLVAGWYWQRSNRREEQSRREVERIARLAAVGELAAGVAHEINNPGGMIQRNLEFVGDVLDDALPLLAEREDVQQLTLGGIDFSQAREELPQLLDDMTRGARRIGEIVRDLKDFARDDAPDSLVKFDLNEAIAAAVRLLDGTIRKATDHFSLTLAPGLPDVFGNLRQIEQVVLNLVQNACQSLPDRTAAVAVVSRFDPGRRLVVVEVADEGVGMTPEQVERIFEPFFTTRREVGGTGLGLSVSQRIIGRHGGTIDVNSVPGNGTVMSVGLAVAEEDA